MAENPQIEAEEQIAENPVLAEGQEKTCESPIGGVEEERREDAGDSNYITIKPRQHGDPVQNHKTTRMIKVKINMVEQRINPGKLSGSCMMVAVLRTMTVISLGMEDESVIQVYQEQSGG